MHIPRHRSAWVVVAATLGLLACASGEQWLTLTHKAAVAEGAGKTAIAETSLLQATRIAADLDRRHSEKELDLEATTFEMLGDTVHKAGRPADAEGHYHEAVRIRRAQFGPNTARQVPTLERIAVVQAEQGLISESRETLVRIEELIRSKQLKDWKALAKAQGSLAEAYLAEGRRAEAAVLFEESFEHHDAREQAGDYQVAERYAHYAQALDGLDRAAEAERARERARSIMAHTDYSDLVLVFGRVARWHDSDMPLRVHVPDPPGYLVADGDATVDLVRKAVDEWTDVAAPGIPRFEFVDSAGEADIRIRWKYEKRYGPAGRCLGTLSVAERKRRPQEQVRLTFLMSGIEVADDQKRLIAIHEVGHALGLKGHSDVPSDIMFPFVDDRMTGISERDRETLRLIYESPPGEEW